MDIHDVFRRLQQGESLEEIAAQLGRKPRTITDNLRKAGYGTVNGKWVYKKKEDKETPQLTNEEIVILKEIAKKYKDIASILDVAKDSNEKNIKIINIF